MDSAAFVISLDGGVFSDPSGEATDVELAGGEEVLAAGRWVIANGRVLTITNESPAFHPSFEQMQAAVTHLAQAGLDLSGDGNGVTVIVYETIDPSGRGENGVTYRAVQVEDSVELVPTQAEDPLDWDALTPEELLTTPGLLANEPIAASATNARRFARSGSSDSYDDIGFRSMAATPTHGPVPLQTIARMQFEKASEQRKQLRPEIEILLKQQRLLRHRPLDLPSTAHVRYEYTREYIDFFVKFEGEDRESPGAWTFPLSSPPDAFLAQMADDSDVPMLFTQFGKIEVPCFWLPMNRLVAEGKFKRMQEWRTDLSQNTEPGCFYAFVSHRWLTTTHPDPDGVHARFLCWQLVGHLCEAIRVASQRGLSAPRKFSRMFGFALGFHGSELAESLIVNVLRHHLDDDTLLAARAEVAGIEELLDDYGIAQAVKEDAIGRLQQVLAACPLLTALLDHIYIWYDYSCMPQRPRTDSEEQEFREALESLVAFQALSRTLVLLDGVEDYLSRAWCTLEAIVADTQLMSVDLLIGSQRATAREGRIEMFFESLLEDRPHLVWRGLLDTEVFGIQTWEECMQRLRLATTEAPDLPFTYQSLLKLSAPTKIHVDGSELVTGIVPLPTVDEGRSVLWARKLERSVKLSAVPTEIRSLDWTDCLRIETGWGQGNGHSAGDHPPFVRFNQEGKGSSQPRCHVVIVGSCEGEAVMISRWVKERCGDLETELGVSVQSMSWVATDIAPVGHFVHGDIGAEPVDADVWVIVALSTRFSNCGLTCNLAELPGVAAGSVVTVAVDLNENNVTVTSAGDHTPSEHEEERFFPLPIPENGLPVIRGGLFRERVPGFLTQHAAGGGEQDG